MPSNPRLNTDGTENDMQIIDPTPAADFPAQVIVVQDSAFGVRNPQAAYYLRVQGENYAFRAHELPNAIGTGHARQMACAMGLEPTHKTCLATAARICSDQRKRL
jgi:hypothetical protein